MDPYPINCTEPQLGANNSSPKPLALRLSFEWGGGILWADDAASRDRFDVGAIEDQLPLSQSLRQQLDQLSLWHDTALDWDDPAGPSPWTAEESAQFEVAAQAALQALRLELGPSYSVRYHPL
ncbi:hypothetical protein [Synechococcus elongatus]|uniref:Uncharacterized protein n=1 Tax=Synechococcus elongatus (strain ATCC 33912 / PCC 7942 / FACHB-805) TaxID=1140 RepID=Q31LD1_SYNE7|nr:hypothetical protein [Synechococcus elongatus]ABB58138.1 conserved hypothetical protein [Synechococcus elongatus PCC 7942 = FACHB-805]AJD57386.1 hypothetical protein M744_05840 [Synechococcus elongatus UTEX 2973]MBD2586857.1 hypothetical protein [Synechococcus elongatus FACHB-242]MBD2687928.1 hypothetical protein [Synechococcus elongatus FACHB-1061]MBD2706361.1 hypothetical protein [Synechococcus elongatus PCC 7942 = FACHB-805]